MEGNDLMNSMNGEPAGVELRPEAPIAASPYEQRGTKNQKHEHQSDMGRSAISTHGAPPPRNSGEDEPSTAGAVNSVSQSLGATTGRSTPARVTLITHKGGSSTGPKPKLIIAQKALRNLGNATPASRPQKKQESKSKKARTAEGVSNTAMKEPESKRLKSAPDTRSAEDIIDEETNEAYRAGWTPGWGPAQSDDNADDSFAPYPESLEDPKPARKTRKT